jgi:DNA-binding NarL/FixJ family response regulator
LTPREVAVLRQLALGLANKEIAQALFISEETSSRM